VDEPPFIIDGARVLAYAALGPGRGTALADGIALEASAAAVAENLSDGAIFLLYCNEEWQTLAAEAHAGKPAAQDAARAQIPAIEWRDYRALSEAELAEIETTRAFLRDLARDFPGGV
jgi:hypothetical protein